MKRFPAALACIIVGILCVGCTERPEPTTSQGKQPETGAGETAPAGQEAGAKGAPPKPTKPVAGARKPNLQRIETLLPEDTIAFVTLDDISRAKAELATTALGAIWREEDVQAFVKKPLAQIKKIMQQLEAMGGFAFDDAARAFGGQVAAALVRIDPPRRRHGDPSVFAVLAAGVTDPAAAGRLFDLAMVLVKKGPMGQMAKPITSDGWRGVTLQVGPMAEVTAALGPDYLILAVAPPGGGDIDMLIAACAKAPEKSLATSDEFRHVTGRLGEGRLATFYLSADRMRESIFEMARAESPRDSALAEKVVATLGLDGVRGVGASIAVDAPGFIQRVYYHAPEPRRGIVALVSDSEVSPATLALAPDGALNYSATSVKLSGIMDLVHEVATVVGEDRSLGFGLQQVKQQFGIDIEKDLLASLGNDLALVVFPAGATGGNPLFMGVGGISIVLEVRDAAKLGPIVDRLIAIGGSLLQANGAGTIEETDYFGTRIRYARIMGGMVSPSVVLTDDRLIITGGLSTAKELVRMSRRKGTPFMESDEVKAAFAKVGGAKGVSVKYADSGQAVTMGTAYTGILAGMMLPAVSGAREAARKTKCISNLKQIILGCALWSGDHNERFPPTLDALTPEYVGDPMLYSCPSSPARRSYKYISGLSAADPADWILAYEPAENHAGRGATVAYIGGRVMWTPDLAALERQVREQVAKAKAKGRAAKVIDADLTPTAVAGASGRGGFDFGEFSDWVDLALLPSPRSYTRHLFPQVGRTFADADGIMSASYGPFGDITSAGGIGGVAVIAAIAIPNLLSSRKASNETVAIVGLRAHLAAQGVFQRVDRYNKGQLVYANSSDGRGFTDLFQVGGLGSANAPLKLIDIAMARATSPATAKAGYYFVDLTGDDIEGNYDYSFACGLCAVPAQYGKSGLNTFVIDLTGTVYKKDNGGKPLTRYPDTTGDDWLPVGF